MVEPLDVARLVGLNGGQLVGKTRLQKSAYFLEAMNVGVGVDFSYYRFGPYSEELSSATDDALAFNLLNVDWKTSQAGDKYAVFSVPASGAHTQPCEGDDQRRKILDTLKGYSSVELELAATAVFLKRNGYSSDTWTETRRRKPNKATNERVTKAMALMQELSLS